MSNKAFLFDLNGTVIDDMGFHTIAWHKILEDLGAKLTQDEVKLQMYGKNSELLERVFGAGHFTVEEMDKYSIEKERQYQEAYKPYLKLIDGLESFLEKACKHQVKMAIGSAAIPFNIDFVLDNLDIRQYFPVIVSAEDVILSKPDPETFVKAANLLGVDPLNCIVFEDNPKGVEAALRGGMKSVVITTMHEPWEFKHLPNVLAFIEDYNDPFLNKLIG